MSGDGAGSVSTDIEGVITNAKAGEYGPITVWRSSPKLLLCDLDSDDAVGQFEEVLPILNSVYGVVKVEAWTSRGGHQHRVVTLKQSVPIEVRLGLQAMLGSDGVKEALSLKRVREGQKEPIILFKPKKVKNAVPVIGSWSDEIGL